MTYDELKIVHTHVFERADRTIVLHPAVKQRIEQHLFERIESMLKQDYPVQPDFGADDVKLPPCDV